MIDPFYFPTKEKDQEKVSAFWKYFPDLNPVLEIDNGFEDGEGTVA